MHGCLCISGSVVLLHSLIVFVFIHSLGQFISAAMHSFVLGCSVLQRYCMSCILRYGVSMNICVWCSLYMRVSSCLSF